MTDSKMPERIWVEDNNGDQDSGVWGVSQESDEDTEYIRADLSHPAPVAALHRSFPEAGDGRPMPPMGDDLMTAGLNSEDARFVAIQLAQNGLTLVPVAARGAVTVKPLVWSKGRAETPFGPYLVIEETNDDEPFWFVMFNGKSASRCGTHGDEASAIAAAQADYEQRILSAILPEGGATCRRCGGEMKPGIAMGQTYVGGLPDFPGDDAAITMSAGGPGQLIGAMKCSACGWSVTEGGA